MGGGEGGGWSTAARVSGLDLKARLDVVLGGLLGFVLVESCFIIQPTGCDGLDGSDGRGVKASGMEELLWKERYISF